MSLDKMFASLKDLNDWKEFAEAQNKVITDLSKKNAELKTEVDHLKSLLESASPLLPSDKTTHAVSFINEDEENICRMEISKLRDISIQRHLTYEETKKLEIYNKILIQIRSTAKTLVPKTKEMKGDDLLAIVQSNNE